MMRDPKTDPIPAPDPATPTVAAPAPMNLAAENNKIQELINTNHSLPESISLLAGEVCRVLTAATEGWASLCRTTRPQGVKDRRAMADIVR